MIMFLFGNIAQTAYQIKRTLPALEIRQAGFADCVTTTETDGQSNF